jgi:CubicO group peptidase (beta-lactamase class C family)
MLRRIAFATSLAAALTLTGVAFAANGAGSNKTSTSTISPPIVLSADRGAGLHDRAALRRHRHIRRFHDGDDHPVREPQLLSERHSGRPGLGNLLHRRGRRGLRALLADLEKRGSRLHRGPRHVLEQRQVEGARVDELPRGRVTERSSSSQARRRPRLSPGPPSISGELLLSASRRCA